MDSKAADSRETLCGRVLQTTAITILVLASVTPTIGCRICQDTEDIAYPAYGGAWERTLRDRGRVGSLFEPAGARAATLINKEQPPAPDEIERTRQAEEDDGSSDDPNEDTDPFADDDSMDSDADSDDDVDEKLERRREQLQELNLQDIQVIPGAPLPPLL